MAYVETLQEQEHGRSPIASPSRRDRIVSHPRRRWMAPCGALGLSLLVSLSANAGDARAGFEVLTTTDNATIAADTVVLRLSGKIEPPLASELTGIWSGLRPQYTRLLFDLDSPGGSLAETEKIVDAIAAIRREARVDTLVRHGATCASACIAVFVQGEQRSAGGASAWLFHGACYEHSNVPSVGLTDRYMDILRKAGVSEEFLCRLIADGYVTTPGKLWLSGYELFHLYDTNVITRLLEPWQAEPPFGPPIDPWLGPR